MKKLLLLALLASCTAKSPDYTHEQQAIIKYVQHNESDSARYVSIKFGQLSPFTRKDSVIEVEHANAAQMDLLRERSESARKILNQAAALHLGQAEIQRRIAEAQEASKNYISAMNEDAKLTELANESVIGQKLLHSWRVGERVDSAHFVVFNNGTVRQLK